MIVGIVPRIYPDELLSSYMKRVAEVNHMSLREAEQLMLGGRTVHGDGLILLIPVSRILSRPMHELLNEHTLFTFASFSLYPVDLELETARLSRWTCGLSAPHKTISSGDRYCPDCAALDRERFGVMYYHRIHNIPGVTVCPIHGVPLINSQGAVSGPGGKGDWAYAKAMTEVLLDRPDVTFPAVRRALVKKINERGITSVDALRQALQGVGMRTHVSDRGLMGLLAEGNYIRYELLLRAVALVYNQGLFLTGETGDEEAIFRIAIQKEKYKLVSPFRYDCVELEHLVCGSRFLTTPEGVRVGWKCPVCEDSDDQKLFRNLFDREACGEYSLDEPFSGWSKKIGIRHEECGRTSLLTPKQFLSERRRCSCRKSLKASDAAAVIASKGPYRLVSFSGTAKKAKILHCTCGRTFEHHYMDFTVNAWCRACRPYMPDEERFKEEIFALTGDEYQLVSPYVDRKTKVVIKHCTCGSELRLAPSTFLSGTRCPACKTPVPEAEMPQYVSEMSGGRYKAAAVPGRSRFYRVEDTRTGKSIVLRKTVLLQELRRPVPGEILPFDPSFRVDRYSQGPTERFVTHLRRLIGERPFTTQDVYDCIGSIFERKQTKSKLKMARRKKLIIAEKRGHYRWPETIT